MEMSGSDAFKAISSLQKLFEDVTSLSDDLYNLVIKNLKERGDLKPLEERVDYSDCWSENGWIVTDHCFSIPLARRVKGRQSAFAYLAFQISLVGAGANVAGEPLLHVCLWEGSVAVEGADEYSFGFPLDEEALESLNNVGRRLLTWDNREKWLPFTWTYSIRLFMLKSKSAITDIIINPVMAMLAIDPSLPRGDWESEAKKALPESLLKEGVLEYKDEWLGLSPK